jgi:hypothetical protein
MPGAALEFGWEDASCDAVRDLVGHFIRTKLFGKPVERRILHSVRALSVETRFRPKRLRKPLRASGLLSADADNLAGGNCLFDAERGSLAAKDAAAPTLSVRKASEHLNAPRVQRDMLYRAGLIVPRVRGSITAPQTSSRPRTWTPSWTGCSTAPCPPSPPVPAQVNIPDAAKQTRCASVEIVRLLLDRKLSR